MRAVALPFKTDNPSPEGFAAAATFTHHRLKQQVSGARHLDNDGRALFSFVEGAEFPA